MKCQVFNKPLRGEIEVPSSKSLSHRAILAAALSKGESVIDRVTYSEDVIATLEAVESMGVSVYRRQNQVRIHSSGQLKTPTAPIDCHESGSTLRFLIPFASLLCEPLVLKGSKRLMERPLEPYWEIFKAQGVRYAHEPEMALMIDGSLKSGNFQLSGGVSSQFVTGLLFVLPLLNGDSTIEIQGTLESRDYVALTIDVLKTFGVTVDWLSESKLLIRGNQTYKASHYEVEADYSQSAFWIAAGAMGESLHLKHMNPKSTQGDKRILEIASQMGAALSWEESTLKVSQSNTRGSVIDASQCPDLVPIVATLAAVSEGTTEIINAGRLRLKESDRLSAISTELKKLGADITEHEESLTIKGVKRLQGGHVNGWNDHRIVMSLAIAALKADSPITIDGAESVQKSYPHFFNDFVSLGGVVT